ncbi:MAG: OmpA family protein [Cyclobacteriaceae bacterium]|nr:OmpA family protein [Cyclobacteriaceae bacterium]
MKTIGLISILFFALVGQANSQQNIPLIHSGFVVVVGAFSVEANAEKCVVFAKKKGLTPQVELNNFKNLYYVVVLETEDRDAALAEAKRIRGTGSFRDTWVFRGAVKDLAAADEHKDFHPVTEQPVITEPVVEQAEPVVVEEPKKMSAADSARLVEERIKAEVDKQVMATKKGEIGRLDYIFFYKDAAVLRPESKYEVDKLVQILKDNPKEEIRIHGHTNGNDPGKIIKRPPTSKDYFSLDGTVEDYGSAKKLSELRANEIRDYLIAHGIDKKRMTVKAWGGKKALFKVDDEKAEANVRVEIEIVK